MPGNAACSAVCTLHCFLSALFSVLIFAGTNFLSGVLIFICTIFVSVLLSVLLSFLAGGTDLLASRPRLFSPQEAVDILHCGC